MSGTGQLPELESLRTQLADLARELAARDQALQTQQQNTESEMQELRQQSDLLRAIMEGTAAETGDEFFAALATHLTSVLQMQYVIIGEIPGANSSRLHTLAVSSGGQLLDNFEYDLAPAPCGTGLSEAFWCFTQGVQTLFPNFPPLAAMGVESHSGVSIRDKRGKVVGLIVVMDTKPIVQQDRLRALLQVFAPRIAAELQRKQAETARRESERRLCFTQFAVDHAVDGVMWADETTRFIYANEAACRSLKYSREELLGLRIPDIVPRHDPDRFQQRLRQIQQGGAATYESIHRRKDGSEFPIEVSVTYLEYEGHGYTCGIIRDITDRKRIEQERSQALCDLQNIMETVPDFMFTLDTQGNLVRWNRRVAEITGYCAEELLNKPALDFVPPEEQEHTAAAIHKAFTEGYAELDGHLLTKDHRLIAYHWTGALLKSPDGAPIGITGVGRDVSEQKLAAEALKRQQQHLIEAQALAHLGSWEWDIASGDTTWSDEQFRIFGHNPGAIAVTYDAFLAALLPDDHDRVLAAINDALLGKRPLDLECRIVRPNGEIRVVHIRADVQRDPANHPISMAGTALDITERKQVQDALYASEERWKLAVQGSHDGIWDWNIQSGEIYFSPRWKTMRGFADHELANKIDEWRSRIHPDDLDRVLHNIDRYLAKQTSDFCEEYRVQRKNGSYMWILDRGVALWSDDGSPLRMAGSETDITERKQGEVALRESEARTRSILETALDAVISINAQGLIIDWNPQAEVMFGYAAQEVLGLPLDETVIPARYRQDHAHGMSRLLQSETEAAVKRRFEFFALHRNGREFPVEFAIASMQIDGRRTFSAFVRDITEQTQAETALRESEERYRALIELSPSGVFVFSEGRTVYVNSMAVTILGATGPNEILERSAFDFIHPDYHEDVRNNLRLVLAGEATVHRAERVYLRVDGTPIQVQVEAVRMMWNGKPAVQGFFSDITERKRAEHRLRLTQFTIDHAVDAIYWIDPQARVVDVNEAASEMLGFSKEDLCTMTVHDLNPGFQADRWPDFWAETQQRGTVVFETSHRTRDGSLVPVEIQVNYIAYEGEEFHCAFVRNITERKRAQEELRRSRARLSYILDSNPAVVYTRQVGNGWPFTFITPNVYELLGYTSIDILTDADRLDQSIHPDDDRELMTTGMPQLLSNGARTFVYRLRHRDGHYCWIENRARLTDDGQGFLQIVGTILDITQRKQAEEALTTSERQLRTVLDALPVGVWFTDRQGTPLLANPAAKTIWSNIKQIGWHTPDNPDGWWESLDPGDAPHRWALSHVLTTGNPSLHETLDLQGLDGTRKTIRNTTVAVRDEAGSVTGAIILNEDLTDLRQVQEALKLTQFSVDHAVEGFFWLDHRGRILNVNAAACHMLEYSRETLITMTIHDIDPNFPPDVWLRHWAELKQKGAMTFESKHWSRTGRVLNTEVTVNYLHYDGQEYNCAIIRDISERKQAEAALRASETRLRLFVEGAPVGMAIMDRQMRYVQVNQAFCTLLGYREEEILGQTFALFTHPDDLAANTEQADTLLATGGPGYRIEKRYLRKTGEAIWVTVNATSLALPDEHEHHIIAIIEDITEQKQAKAALQASEELFSKAFRSSPYPIVLSELETGRFIDANDASYSVFGYGPEEIAGHTSEEVGLWPSHDDRLRFVHSLKQAGTIRNVEVDLRNKEGKIRRCLLSAELIELHGKPCMLTVGQDITEQKRAEEALRASEELFAKAFRASPNPIGITEVGTGRCVDTNDACLELFGFSREEVVGQTTLMLGIWPDPQDRDKLISRLRTSGPVRNAEMTFHTKSGKCRHILVSADLVEMSGATCLITVGNDITERIEAEAALREQHALLSAIMNTTTDIIFVKDLQGHYLHINSAGARMVGLSPQDVVGKDDDAIWPADLAACCKEADRQILATGSAQTMEESTTANGTRITYLTTKAPYRDAAGRVIGIIGMAHDISQIKQSEVDLRRSRDFIRQIIDTTPNFIFAKDRKGRFTLVNKALADAYGTTVDQLIGKTDPYFSTQTQELEVFRTNDLEVLDSLWERFIPETMITDAAGRTRWLQTVKRPILDDHGIATMVLGACTDITERKGIEEALRQRERDLRTALEERERISQDLHDGILQSLYAIGLGLESCKPLMRQRQHKKAADLLEQAISQMNHVMGEVRNFIAGLDSDVLQGGQFSAALHSMIQTLLANQPIRCQLKIDETTVCQLSTEQALHVMNIVREALSNSLRHGQATKTVISLKPLARSIRLTIRDNGKGFDPGHVHGLGHGLSNMESRARKIGGHFAIHSARDCGTRVTIDLPKEKPHD